MFRTPLLISDELFSSPSTMYATMSKKRGMASPNISRIRRFFFLATSPNVACKLYVRKQRFTLVVGRVGMVIVCVTCYTGLRADTRKTSTEHVPSWSEGRKWHFGSEHTSLKNQCCREHRLGSESESQSQCRVGVGLGLGLGLRVRVRVVASTQARTTLRLCA